MELKSYRIILNKNAHSVIFVTEQEEVKVEIEYLDKSVPEIIRLFQDYSVNH